MVLAWPEADLGVGSCSPEGLSEHSNVDRVAFVIEHITVRSQSRRMVKSSYGSISPIGIVGIGWGGLMLGGIIFIGPPNPPAAIGGAGPGNENPTVPIGGAGQGITLESISCKSWPLLEAQI